MSTQQCHCYGTCIWMIRRGSVILSDFVNISQFLGFRLWSHLICSYRSLFVNHLFFSLLLYPPLSLYSLLFPSPHSSTSISSFLLTLSPFAPWSICNTQRKLHIARPADPLTAHRYPSVDMLFLVNLSKSFSPCGWQVCVVGPDSRQS